MGIPTMCNKGFANQSAGSPPRPAWKTSEISLSLQRKRRSVPESVGEKERVDRQEEHLPTYPGWLLIIKCGLDFRLASEEVVDFLPTVVICVHHSSHLSARTLREARVNKMTGGGA
jgi:hypothetical protein